MRTHALFAAAVALLAAGPAWAVPPLHVQLGYASEVVTHRSWDFVDGNDHLPLFKLGAGYTLALQSGALDLGLAFRAGGSSAFSFGVNTDLLLRGGEVAATWRHPMTSWLHPYGRLGLALDWATLKVRGGALEQTVLSPAGTAQLGVQLRHRPPRLPGWLTFDVGVGYTLRPEARFGALQPPPPDKPGPEDVRSGGVDLGALPLGGIAYQLLLGVQL
jgi:hypothetical protein